MIGPREWQIPALEDYTQHIKNNKTYLLDATPACGKTIFSGLCAKRLLEDDVIDFAIVVVPGTPIKRGFLEEWNKCAIDLTTKLSSSDARPLEFQAAAVTYQQLPNLISLLRTWARNGVRLLLVFDEVHHLCDTNVWGNAANQAAEIAAKILSMTGTPFRTDKEDISFVAYDERHQAIANYRYSYREAVRDKVCRAVEFITDDGLARWSEDDEKGESRISDAKTDDERNIARVIFNDKSEWLSTVIERADDMVESYRIFDLDAGALIVCRPGNDEFDDKHLRGVGKLVQKVVGQMPEVVTHDDDGADDKIDTFRGDHQRWIAAVRKISEGVDIPRLRVLVIAANIQSELLFRQLVGRILRVDDKKRPGPATVFLPKFPHMVEWASRISDEAKAGKKERAERAQKSNDEAEDERLTSKFVSLGATHEHGGAISNYGEMYTAQEISAAEKTKQGDPELIDVSVTKIAHILKKAGVEPPPIEAAAEPLFVMKNKLRKVIDRKFKALAIRLDPKAPDYIAVWRRIGDFSGARTMDDLMNNKSIEVARQVDEWLTVQLSGAVDGDERKTG